ncbi:MAG: hypothetical protein ACREP9_08045 [Candidatus Dormibacteraceae bacterium]
MIGVKHWPIRGNIEYFYSGGYSDDQQDLKRLLRQIARWMEHTQPPGQTVDAITIYPSFDLVEGGESITWAANVWLVPA